MIDTLVCIAVGLLCAGCCAATSPRLAQALALQRAGNLKEAHKLLREILPGLRVSRDTASLLEGLSADSRIAAMLGDYALSVAEAREALSLRRQRHDEAAANEDVNTIGLAHLYAGDYGTARADFEEALRLDRRQGDREGEIIRLNNLGNVGYFQGRYQDALSLYQQALQQVNANPVAPWYGWRRQLTLANLATLYQRLGKEQAALDLYRRLANGPAMPANERAQVLLNEGVLYRRLGDPVKALAMYREAQRLFARDHHLDGEIGALRNIGIVQALDFHQLEDALGSFTAVLRIASQSANVRGTVHAALYLAEILRRLNRLPSAERQARTALELARRAGLTEEQWMALYALGGIAAASDRPAQAAEFFRDAIQIIESVRSGLTAASLRSEFLADKRDVYDAVVALLLRQKPVPVADLFQWIERSRARTLEERAPAATARASLQSVQARLAPDAVLVDYWTGQGLAAAVWMTPAHSGVLLLNDPVPLAAELAGVLPLPGDAWQPLARRLGSMLLDGIPPARHLIVVPDSALFTVPFELLEVPRRAQSLLESCDVTYLPAAQFMDRGIHAGTHRLAPWRTELVALADPPLSRADPLSGDASWQPLPASAAEVHAIAAELPGRAEIHVGTDARKFWLSGSRLTGVPILHLSTHAVIDNVNPDRSRILLAPAAPATGPDYLFLKEVYGLDLAHVGLVTVSACDTARGKMVGGEGVEAFSQAFLAAGAAATVTSLWRVADSPTAQFMKQFYFYLARGQPKATALRAAKLALLRSKSAWSAPRYWAPFVLYGDGWDACARAVPASYVLWTGALLLAGAALLYARSPR